MEQPSSRPLRQLPKFSNDPFLANEFKKLSQARSLSPVSAQTSRVRIADLLAPSKAHAQRTPGTLGTAKSQSVLVGTDELFDMLEKVDDQIKTHKARAVAIGQGKQPN